MSHDIANRLDADPASEQAHRKAVAQLIGVNRMRKTGLMSALLEEIFYSGALDRPARAACPQEELRMRCPLSITATGQVLS